MQKLQVTTPALDGHYHVAYIKSETGVGGTAPGGKDGHIHELIYDPAREPTEEIPPEFDEFGQMISEGQPADPGKEVGEWIVQPGGQDFHMHDGFKDVRLQAKEKREPEKTTIDECLALWREALSITSDSVKLGRESEEFYSGKKQWKDETKRDLEANNRAALTINEIIGNVDTLLGYQMENRTDFRYLPQEGGDQRVADMLNIIVKKVVDACGYQRQETKVFKDQVVAGKGNYKVYMDFTNNIQGDVKIKRFPWDDAVEGPHEEEDLEDCEYTVLSRMVSLAKLKQLYGKKADEVEKSFRSYCGQHPDLERYDNGVSGTNTDYKYAKKLDDVPFTVDGTIPLVDIQKKQFRLVEVTRKTYKEVTVIFNKDENFFYPAHDWREEDIESARQIPGFQVVAQMKTRMRITKFCGTVVLSDENPADLPLHDFYTVPVYAYRQNGEFWGKVEVAKDPQREINKRRSQIMDQMNRTGTSVYYIDNETFPNDQERENFKKNRAKPGSVFTLLNSGRTPVKEEGGDLPRGVSEIMQMDQSNLQRLINVITQPGGANESGTLFDERKKGQLTQNQFLFENLSFAKQKLGKIILFLIQRYYPAERLERLLNSQNSREKFQVGGEDYDQFSRDEIIEMLENADLTEYDVIVTESAFSASTRLAVAKTIFEMIKQGAQIPPELAFWFMDMPADLRMKVNNTLQQQSEAAMQSQADTSNSEITKTLIAKGQYTVTPEKAQEMGLVPVQGNPLPEDTGIPQAGSETDIQATEYATNPGSALAG